MRAAPTLLVLTLSCSIWATVVAQDCKDNNPECSRNACGNPYLKNVVCRKSCGVCVATNVCTNTAADNGLDTGCSAETPRCIGGAAGDTGSMIPYPSNNGAGDQCIAAVTCINNNVNNLQDTRCSTALPRCINSTAGADGDTGVTPLYGANVSGGPISNFTGMNGIGDKCREIHCVDMVANSTQIFADPGCTPEKKRCTKMFSQDDGSFGQGNTCEAI